MQSYEKKEFFPIEKSGTLRGKLYLCCFKKTIMSRLSEFKEFYLRVVLPNTP